MSVLKKTLCAFSDCNGVLSGDFSNHLGDFLNKCKENITNDEIKNIVEEIFGKNHQNFSIYLQIFIVGVIFKNMQEINNIENSEEFNDFLKSYSYILDKISYNKKNETIYCFNFWRAMKILKKMVCAKSNKIFYINICSRCDGWGYFYVSGSGKTILNKIREDIYHKEMGFEKNNKSLLGKRKHENDSLCVLVNILENTIN